MSLPLPQSLDLPEEVQEWLTRYVSQVNQSWSSDLLALVLFGSAARGDFVIGRSNLNVLLVVKHVSTDILLRAGTLHQQWGKHQIIAPLVMTAEDLSISQSLFPLEFLQMTNHHVILAGQELFGQELIKTKRLGWQCEQELLANLLRLRQRFIEGEGRIEAIQTLLILSVTAVLPIIRGILYILGHPSNNKDIEILEALPTTLNFDSTIFLEILLMKRGLRSPGAFEWVKAYERYLQNFELFMKHVQEIHLESHQ